MNDPLQVIDHQKGLVQVRNGKDAKEATTKFYGVLCDDIKRERERIGGDWAMALVVNTRGLRDFVRSRLGPDLTFVVLDMAWEDLEERLRSRHSGDETRLGMWMVSYGYFNNKQIWQV